MSEKHALMYVVEKSRGYSKRKILWYSIWKCSSHWWTKSKCECYITNHTVWKSWLANSILLLCCWDIYCFLVLTWISVSMFEM